LMVDQSDCSVVGKNFPGSWHFWYGLWHIDNLTFCVAK
jgi:hypothetical protein